MHKNANGQDVRDAAETEAWVRAALSGAGRSDADLVAHARSSGVPGFVALRVMRELEGRGEVERAAGRARLKLR